jgi:thioredoxin
MVPSFLGVLACFAAVRIAPGTAGVRSGIAPVALRSMLVHRQSRATVTMSKAEELNTEAFSAAAQGELPLLVDVYAHWCGPCQLMAPQLDLVAESYVDRVRVVKIDSDKEEALAQYLRIMGLPTLLFIKDKAVVGRVEGAMMQAEISALIEHYFFDGPKPEI